MKTPQRLPDDPRGSCVPRSHRPLSPAAAGLLLLVAGACAGGPSERPQVTPQRPTFSSDTSTTAHGTLELEAGVEVDPGDRFSTPLALKWGHSPTSELFLTASPLEFVGDDVEGFGDMGIGTRARIWEDDATSAALRLFAKLPTASTKLGFSRQVDFFTAGIVSHQLDDDTAATGYYEIGVLGDPGGGGADLQHLLALALSSNVAEDVAAFGELTGITSNPGGDPLYLTLGLARSVVSYFTFDGGVRVGLNDDAQDVAFLLGLTTNFGYVSDPDGLD